MYRLIAILLILSLAGSAVAQKITLQDRIIAEHIYNFGIYVNWKKNKSIKDFDTDKFNIGVYSNDTSMYYLLEKICKWRVIKWKKIEVSRFTNVSDIRYVQVLYVSRDMNGQILDIDKRIQEWPTLLITDSCHNFENVMINFFPRNSLKKVEINKKNIENRGMKASPLLFTVAKEYEKDWESAFRESEVQLAIEKELVAQQQAVLEEKSREIKIKEAQIKDLSDKIDEKEKHLARQMEQLLESQAELKEKMDQIAEKSRILASQKSVIRGQENDIKTKKEELLRQAREYEKQKQVLEKQQSEIHEQQSMIDAQKVKLSVTLENMKKQQLVMYFLGVVVVMIALLAFMTYRNLRMKKKINAALKRKNVEIFHQKEEIQSQRDEIEAQRDEITAQRDTVINQKKQIEIILGEITSSIHYAGRIQKAILPAQARWDNFPFEHFVIYNPRDIISGDFYWFEKISNHIIFCVADCTGHGVPGAFMSMLGVAALNDAVKEKDTCDPAKILNRTRDYIISALHQTKHSETKQFMPSVKDGMDVAICSIDLASLELQFAGANNPLYIVKRFENLKIDQFENATKAETSDSSTFSNLQINKSSNQQNGTIVEVKPDKMPIGIHERMDSFTAKKHQLRKGDCIYIFSDGIADQFGGPDNKKFKYRQLREILAANHTKKMYIQKNSIEDAFIKWKGTIDQIDDVTIMGVRI